MTGIIHIGATWFAAILLSIWIIELVGTLLIYIKLEREDFEPEYKEAFFKWLWLQVWLFTCIFWWFSPLETLSDTAFEHMG